MNWTAPILFVCAIVLAFFNWRAQRSGVVQLKGLHRRADAPAQFWFSIVVRWAFVAAWIGWVVAIVAGHGE